MTDKLPVRRGEASVQGTQLPKGGAEELNAAYKATQNQPKETQASTQPQTPQPGASGTQTPEIPLGIAPQPQGPMTLPNEEDNLLLGPTSRPQEAVTTGALTHGGGMPVPREVYQALPALQTAAKIPGAPKQLVGLVELLNHLLSTQ